MIGRDGKIQGCEEEYVSSKCKQTCGICNDGEQNYMSTAMSIFILEKRFQRSILLQKLHRLLPCCFAAGVGEPCTRGRDCLSGFCNRDIYRCGRSKEEFFQLINITELLAQTIFCHNIMTICLCLQKTINEIRNEPTCIPLWTLTWIWIWMTPGHKRYGC